MSKRSNLTAGLIVLIVFIAAATFAQTPDDDPPAVEPVCDELQGGTPGLYGLCVAFCEAHDCEPDLSLENPFENCKPASMKILENYNKQKAAGDPEMPCVVADACPCFTQAELDSIAPQASGQYTQCDDMPPMTNIIAAYSPLSVAQVQEDTGQCLLILDGVLIRNLLLTSGEAVACRELLVDTIATSPYCP